MRVQLRRLYRERAFVSGLRAAVLLAATKLESGIGGIRRSKISPGRSIIRINPGRLLEHFDRQGKIVPAMEIDSPQIIFVGERIDGRVGLDTVGFGWRQVQLQSLDNL